MVRDEKHLALRATDEQARVEAKEERELGKFRRAQDKLFKQQKEQREEEVLLSAEKDKELAAEKRQAYLLKSAKDKLASNEAKKSSAQAELTRQTAAATS